MTLFFISLWPFIIAVELGSIEQNIRRIADAADRANQKEG